MIKGINKQIIEINQTGSLYYEKALLVVKPEFSSVQQQLLEREAIRILKKMDAPSSYKRKSRLAVKILLGCTCALSGGLLAYFMFKAGLIG
ncbi:MULTISPECIES: hypothetical protein [unclassified Ruminococcus]|uniref:hypothetical protein n=1 Tax=unclassified Ruminococcus TaxID=2608920 RepID=UPI00210CECC2|nr:MULTISPECIES: hypothetical protein [unclassified Ruminococcus]MCQ4022183.1 hypothetical protein [Ruminococcus sp. zg-924]MCQ4115581.1 hypothetical protein [Ruminococcus sp. zg-921]